MHLESKNTNAELTIMSGLIFFLKNSIRMAKDFYVLVKDKSYSASSKTLTVY